jgi:hypothetical protein
MGGFFKKPKAQEQESGNKAYGDISGALKPALGYVTQGGDALANLLGVGSGDQSAALDKFANSSGMSWLMDQGNRMINSNQAAKGLLQSGSTLAASQKYGQGLGSTYLNSYMDKLLGLGNLGNQSAGVLSSAGQWSKGQGPTQGGMGKQLLPMIASAGLTAAASDRGLKEDIVPIGNMQYEFRYKQDTPLDLPEGLFRGYMADEVPSENVVDIGHGFKGVTAPYLPERIDD